MRLTSKINDKYTLFAQVVGLEQGRMICGVEKGFLHGEFGANFYRRINTVNSILSIIQLR